MIAATTDATPGDEPAVPASQVPSGQSPAGPWPASSDWVGWAANWEARMGAFFPRRADCLEAILSLLAALLPPGPWRILDLGAGTGTLSRAVLARYQGATVTALELDPVLLAIGQGAADRDTLGVIETAPPHPSTIDHTGRRGEEHLSPSSARLRWVQADLRDPTWPSQAGAPASFDAVLSLATLHHFTGRELAAIYADLARLIRPGGLLVNAEQLAAGRPSTRLAQRFDDLRRRGAPPADGWWDAVEADPALAVAVAERATLRGRMRGAGRKLSAEAHCRAMRRAGFAEATVAWRWFDEAAVVALR